MDSIERAADAAQVQRVDVNATISGFSQETYDVYQGGARLQDTVASYRELSFDRAMNNVLLVASESQRRGLLDDHKVVIRIKGYGIDLPESSFTEFWRNLLVERGMEDVLEAEKIQVLVNHGYTTFARAETVPVIGVRYACATDWLDQRLAIGPGGEVRLCCEDGLSNANLGNLLDDTLEQTVATEAFQRYLRVTSGQQPASQDSPCSRCQHYRACT